MRLPYLDGLRGFCALYITVNHASAQFLGPGNLNWFTYLLTRSLGYGHLAVTIFILLSGFSLGLQVANGKPFQTIPFLKRRYWRIAPPLYALMLPAIVLAFIRFRLLGVDWVPDPKQIVFNLLLLNDVLPDTELVTWQLWTVALEAKIYCLFPLLVYLYRRNGALAVGVFATFVSTIACVIATKTGKQDLSLWYIGLFALGFLASQKALPLPKASAWVAAGLLGTLFLWFPIWGDWYAPGNYHYHQLEFDLALGLLCASLFQLSLTALKSSRAEDCLTVPVLTWLGMCSYSLYLVHQPVYACWQALALSVGYNNRPVLFSAAVVLALVSGRLFYWTVERHFVRYRHSDRPSGGL